MISREVGYDALKEQFDERGELVAELKIKIKVLEKATPKSALVAENLGLKSNNSNLRKSVGVLRVETVRLKEVEKKYKEILRKFGSNDVRAKQMNTKEEIKSCLHEPILDLYNHYSSKQFYEVDTILFVTLHYLDMSGGAKHELILKLRKFSSHGIKVSVCNLLEKMIKNEKLELQTVVEDLTEKDIFDPNRTPSNSSHPGIVNIRGKPSTRPTDYDPSWDGFDKAKFQSSSNTGCKFVRTKSVTFIAASSNLADLMYHKLNRPVPCGIPDCEVVFEFGKTFIGRALICSPDTNGLC